MNKQMKIFLTIFTLSILLFMSGCSKTANTNLPTGNEQNQTINPSNPVNSNIPTLVKEKKTIELANVKFEEVSLPSDCKTIGWIDTSDNFVFFTGGTDKPSKSTPPCLNYIERLYSYDIEAKKIQTIAEIDKGFVQIDWVGANKNWIVYREIAYEFGGPERIYVIDRNNNTKRVVFEKNECASCVSFLNLWNDYLVFTQSSLEPTKRDQNGKITDGLFYNSIKIINLKTNESKEIFNKSSSFSLHGAIFSTSVNSDYLVFNYAEGGKQTIYAYSLNNDAPKEIIEVPLMSDSTGSNNFLTTHVLLTEDNQIIFDYPKDAKSNLFSTVIAPIENINLMKSLFDTIPSSYIMWPKFESKDYIVWSNRQEATLNILNRNSGVLTSINGVGGSAGWINSDEIVLDYGKPVNDNVIEELLFIKLSENGL
jgi:hypothetical protein